jgi:hypothetical protein
MTATSPAKTALSEEILQGCWTIFLERMPRAASNRSDARSLWFHVLALRLAQNFPDRWDEARALFQKWISQADRRLPLLKKWQPQLASPDPETILSREFQALRSVSPLAALIKPGEHREALVFFQRHYHED